MSQDESPQDGLPQDELSRDGLSRDGLSPCKTCGEEISRNIDGVILHGRCPKCGEKDPHGFVAESIAKNEEFKKGCLIVFAIVLAIGFLGRMCGY